MTICFLVFSFHTTADAQSKVKETFVKGILKGQPGVTEILLKIPNKEANVVSSSKIAADGSFLINVPILETNLYKLWISDNSNMLLVVSPGDQIEINANSAALTFQPEIKGSSETKLLHFTLGEISTINAQLDSIEKVYKANQASPKIDSILPALQAQFMQRDAVKKDIIRKFISINSGSLSCLVFIDNLELETEFPVYDLMDQALNKKYPKNLFVKDFHVKVEAERSTAIGAIAPEISLTDTNGKIVPLSSLRGKIVLIDFWASWCGPCRKENPHVVEVFQKYHAQGFEVFSVSLDRDRDKWIDAIKKDGLTWTHVSDLQYWKSEGAKTYGISAIPATVLIDKDGKIISKKLRGPSLDEKLKEIFGF